MLRRTVIWQPVVFGWLVRWRPCTAVATNIVYIQYAVWPVEYTLLQRRQQRTPGHPISGRLPSWGVAVPTSEGSHLRGLQGHFGLM